MTDVVDPFKNPPQPQVAKGEIADPFAPGYVAPDTSVGDVLKSGVAGAVQGLGAIAQGGGNLVAQAVNRGSQALTGYNPMLRAEDPLKPVSDAVLDSRTEGGKLAMQLSTPTGDVTKPETWSLGDAPSIGGYLQQGANVVGQFVGPGVVGAAAKLGKASAFTQEALGAVQGGLQAGGAAAAQEGEAVRKAKHDDLFRDSKAYRDYLASGIPPAEARERTALDVELGAGTIGAIPAAAEGAVLQGLLRGRLKMPTVGGGPIARAASAVVGGGVAEGAQEGVEGVAQKLGANVGGGMNQSLTEDSFQNVVLGAIGGAAGGGAIKALQGEPKKGDDKPAVDPNQKLLPAPGAIPIQAGQGGDVSDPARALAADAAAAELYAARDKVEQEKAAFASNGVISAAAVGAINAGATEQAQAKREAAIAETLNPAQPLALPAPVAEKEKIDQQKVDEYLAGKDSTSLTEAQRKSFEGEARGHNLVVVPHPSGKGYTTIPASKLSDRQQRAVENIQRPDQGQLPSPRDEMPGAWVAPEGRTPEPRTYGENNAGMRAEMDRWRTAMGTPVPKQMPIDDAKRAAAIAERKTQETGREHTVVAHPMSATKFAVAPVPTTIDSTATRVQDSQPFTGREQPAGVNNASQEAAVTQPQSAGVANDQANVAGAPAAAGPSAAAEAPQAEGLVSQNETPATIPAGSEAGLSQFPVDVWAKRYPNEAEPWMRHAGEMVGDKWLPRADAAVERGRVQAAEIAARADEAATSLNNDLPQPSAAQAAAGNYKKGHVKLHGLDISIENPAGSVRVAKDGSWASAMPNHYGYIKRTEGNDGDHVDTFIGPKPESKQVFIVDQVDPKTGEFDEHKVLLGFDSQEAAEAGYKAAYPADWKGMGTVTATTVDGLKEWVKSGDTKAPFAPTTRASADMVGDASGYSSTSLDFAARPVTTADPKQMRNVAHLFGQPAARVIDIDGGEAASPEESKAIAAIVQEAARLGLPEAAQNGLRPIAVLPGSHQGVYWFETRTVALTRDDLLLGARGNKWAAITNVGKYIHEVMHHITGDDNGNSFAAKSPAFAIGRTLKGARVPNGSVISEAFYAWANGKRELSRFLDYPFKAWGDKLLSAEHTLVLQDEVMAQIGRLYYTNPRLLRLEMPKAFAMMEGLHNEVAVGGTIDATRGRVREYLRTLGAKVGDRVDVARGSGRADQAGAGGQQAGAGLGGRAVRESASVEGDGGRAGRGDARLEAAPEAGQAQRLTGAPEGYEPSARAQQVAREYMKSAGLPYSPPTEYVKVDPARAKRIAQAYADMKHEPGSLPVKAAYAKMIRETIAQWKAIEKTGLKVTFATAEKPYPYTVPGEVFADVNENNHMWVFPTIEGFGSDASVDVSDNPLLEDTGIVIGGHKLVANDVFRIVHDYFGHIKNGVGFRANGEENAWRAHAAMYSPLARRAMTSETRGQNSWLNFGPHGEKNRTAKTEDTIFADQKTGLLPEWVSEDNYAKRPGALEVRDPERIVKNDLTKDEQGILAAKKGKIREAAIENFSKVFDKLPSADEFAAAAWSGRAKRGWYRHSAEAIAHVFGPDAPRFTALLAALSPQTSVENNLENALRVWRGWVAAKRPTDRRAILRIAGENVQGDKGEESVLGAWVNNMHRALTSADPIAVVLSGPKVDSFMRNLLGNVQEVTNDAWMANFALVDQTLFAGTGINEETRDPGKGFGYLAYSARVRQAAKRLTKLTGETWTPAEVQETVWSWAKTILEQAQAEGMSSVDFLKSGKLTDELINATPDFRTLFHGGTYERILEQAGLGERVKSLRASGQPDAGSGTQVAGAGSQAGPFAGETQAKLDERNAARIDQLRAKRIADERKTERDNARRAAVHALRKGEPAYAARAGDGGKARLPVTLGKEKFAPIQTLVPSAAAKATLEKAGADAPIVHELPAAAAAEFRKAIEGTKRGNKFASSVHVYSDDEYAKMRLFVTHGGKAGFALNGDDIVSVFSYGKVKQAAATMMNLAVQMGGRRLDAFDTALPKIYADHGFVAAARVRWDDSQAPAGWDKKLYEQFRNGEPDVVFMAYDPEFFGEYKKTQGKVLPYDEAVQAQATAVANQNVVEEYRDAATRPNAMAVNDQTQTPEFKKWFGDSKVVDENGKPLVVYHGTPSDFSKFAPTTLEDDEGGIYFTTSPRVAGEYSYKTVDDAAPNVIPAYLNISNPYRSTAEEWANSEGLSLQEARDEGHDGYLIDGQHGYETWIAFRPEQIKSAIGNNGNFDAKRPSILEARDEQQPLWYSSLATAIESKAPFAKDGTIPAGQLRMWLAARSKDGVVKAEELKWSGVDEWLEVLVENDIKRISKAEVTKFIADNGVKVDEVELSETTAGDWAIARDGDEFVVMNMSNGEEYERFESDEEAIGVARGLNRDANQSDVKFSSYQLPGGENYRELLLTLPDKRSDARYDELRALGMSNVDALRKIDDEAGPEFRSSHFDEPNILAHIRFNERTDAEGKRVLFIEEIQSDWAQKGRKEGFEQKAERVTIRFGEGYNKTTGVPSAPFVAKTEAWVALALKRMIRYAADNGFDRVAWTTGEQQAERYDLSKQVQFIDYTKKSDGSYFLKIETVDGQGVTEPNISASKLEDYVGKEVAKKIMAGEGREVGAPEGSGILRGVDLKVGGEGMRAFYDKIVPNVANDLLKKMGGGRVSDVLVKQKTVAKIGRNWGILEDDGDISSRTRGDTPASIAKLMKLASPPQPGFDITPEMAPAARRPQALFVNAAQVQDAVHDQLTTSRSFNLWDRTVGTQLNKALKNPMFAKVYHGVQAFLNDISQMMMEAADLAPDLLPKLDGLKDVLKRGLSKDDLSKVSSAVFDGTLNDKVYTDAELTQRGLNADQIGYYRQARKAIDKSLYDAVASEAVKQARGLLPQSVLDQAKAAGDPWIVVNALSAIATRTPVQQQVYDQLRQRAAEVSDLQAKGYAPLQRFGQYTVHVVNPDGSSALFTMHESEREANAFARAARAGLTQGQTLTQGVMSQEAWKLFQGVSPDTLQIFAESLGASQSEVMQKYIKLAANNRSVLKRMLERKEIAGFQTDVQRTLAQFITSNARAAAKNYHWGDVLRAAQQIPKEAGDVKDEAVKLTQYMETAQEEAGALRGLLFIQFLGGSIASAITNATQPVMMTFPWLAQFGGAAKAAAQLTRAGKIALGGTAMEPGLRAAMDRATKEGIVAPHEVAGLYAESIRNFGSNMAVRRGLKIWGSLFSLAEGFNRRITFVAAYRTAVEQNMPDPYEFATRAIAETQGVYNRGNRPNWARGAVGATLFTFKQYSVAYVELLNRLPAKQKAVALAVLVLASGLQGLPGADDLEDVIDTIAESLGYSFNSKKQLREWAARTLGDTAGGMLTHGFSALPGVPIDVQARLGLGNLIPGTAILKRSETDKSRDVLEFFGPAGSQAQSFVDAFSAAQEGRPEEVFKAGVPLAIKNALKGLDMAQSGFYKDMKGRRVMDVDSYDAVMKGIGFQPQKVAKQSRVVQDVQQDINLAKDVEASLVERMARGIVEHDPDALQKARVELFQWNQRNPDARIGISPHQVQQRVKQMNMTREQRFAKTAPREMRQYVREELRQ